MTDRKRRQRRATAPEEAAGGCPSRFPGLRARNGCCWGRELCRGRAAPAQAQLVAPPGCEAGKEPPLPGKPMLPTQTDQRQWRTQAREWLSLSSRAEQALLWPHIVMSQGSHLGMALPTVTGKSGVRPHAGPGSGQQVVLEARGGPRRAHQCCRQSWGGDQAQHRAALHARPTIPRALVGRRARLALSGGQSGWEGHQKSPAASGQLLASHSDPQTPWGAQPDPCFLWPLPGTCHLETAYF